MDDSATPPPPAAQAKAPLAEHAHTAHPPAQVPNEQCQLRFLLINGESFRLFFPPPSTIHHVKQKVIEQQPKELVAFLKESNPNAISGPAKTEEIRILHLGKFLDDAKTLQECKFASGPDNLTTVHISLRVPTKASEDVKEKINKKGSACCAIM